MGTTKWTQWVIEEEETGKEEEEMKLKEGHIEGNTEGTGGKFME